MSEREDSRPDYLKGKQGHIFSESDKPFKFAESAEQQIDAIVRDMPEEQRHPFEGKVRDVDWLLRGDPRPVQVEALRRSYYGYWMKQDEHDENETAYSVRDSRGSSRTVPAGGWNYFMEQRLGKTPVFLNEFGLLRRDHGFKWGVVYAPQQFKPEWVDEADRFGLDCPSYMFSSDDSKGAQRWVDRNSKFGGLIAVNYEALQSERGRAFIEGLAGPKSLLGWDESVNNKNMNGKQSGNAIDMSKKFGVVRNLTGKPVVQGPHDFWAQLRCVRQISGWNGIDFRNRYCKLGGFQGRKVIGVKREDELYELLVSCSFMARRNKWLQTPGKDYYIRPIEMLTEQKVHYKRMEEDFLTFIEHEYADGGQDAIVIAADQIITKLLKLQQIASGFIIDEMGVPHDIMPAPRNPKLIEARRMLTEEIESKVILFAHYRHSIDLLMEALAEFEPALIAGDAQMRQYKRDVQTEKRRFNGDRGCRVVIGQIQAIRYGHTLMGTPEDPCLNELYYENNYSLNDRSQTEERPQGAGQIGTISIGDFQAAPIERDTLEALQRKEDISSAVMNYARSTGILPR
jgi:hypothetical protein